MAEEGGVQYLPDRYLRHQLCLWLDLEGLELSLRSRATPSWQRSWEWRAEGEGLSREHTAYCCLCDQNYAFEGATNAIELCSLVALGIRWKYLELRDRRDEMVAYDSQIR